ncbi:PREDICTED: synemin [Thamnophis sirtalis]|uniref:Synemin n=1 Tax=Thamnophis sirtalis TaxID=35019 RepID=A0A6I9Z4Z2_9SAUR|nr:PREDICTED: synemin [Thamnophis sirtalis]
MQRDEWDEQSELRELNARLQLYVRRVRDLEQENGRLAHELAALRGREGRAGRWQETEREVAELRRVVAELSRAKGEGELERDALRHELESLERLSAQLGELRLRRLEPELARRQQQLEGLWADCAALEALLEQLLAEHEGLQEARKQRPAALLSAPRVLRAGRSEKRQLASDYALVLSWSCAQSLERYEAELRALQELEGGRLGQQDLHKLRAQNQESRRRLEELWHRCRELCALGERLEEERLAQQESHGAQLAEYQMIIEALQEEKSYLTMSIAEYLKDYHELLQVKAGLSLEIETYRALLEAEGRQWILMWNEEHGRRLPKGDRNLRYDYSNRYSAYQQEKGRKALPAIPNVDLRYKFPQTNMSRSVFSSSRTESARRQRVLPEKKALPKEPFRPGQRPSTTTERHVTHERSLIGQRERQSFTSPYRMSRDSDLQPRPPAPERKTTEMGSMASALKESTILQKQMKRPMSSEGIRSTVIITSPLSPSSTSSSSKGSQYETREGILGYINELIKEGKPGKEEKHVLVEGVEQKEKLAEEATGSAMKNFEKLYGVEKTVQKKAEVKEVENKEDTVEESIFKRKEEKLMKDNVPFRRWEEQIKVEAEGKKIPKDTETFGREKIVTTSSKTQETFEVPIYSGHTEGKILQKNHNIEITLQDFQTPPEKSKEEAEFKLGNEMTQGYRTKEEDSEIDASHTESIAESIVSDILKGFVQKSSEEGLPPEAKITSFEKEEISEDGKVKTKISIESTVQEDDLDASNKSELGSFLEKDLKKVLEDTKGSLDENVLDNIINVGMKGMENKAKRTIKVEIIEEPATIVDERVEFSTPFEVEEAEDTFLNVREHPYHSDKEKATPSVSGDRKEKQPDEIVSHVEEVSEGDDVVDEEKYFVSTPDEYPFGYEEGEGSTYGQIHFEEESTVKYSWQDEFLEGSQTNIKEGLASSEMIYQVIGADAGSFISKAEAPKEQVAHAESLVIEKEIKIPHEFQESIKEVFSHHSKDPKHQLKEALGKLEATLPELVKQELGELTEEDKADSSTLEVDIKKVEHPEKEGVFTIVAEVNLSQTIDTDQLSTEWLGEVGGDQMKLSKQSPNEGSFEQYIKQEPETWQDEKHHVDVSSTHWTTEDTSKREDAYPSKESFDINRHIRHVVVGPTEIRKTEHVFYEGPTSDTLEFGTVDFTTGVSTDAGQFKKEIKLSPEITETTEKIIYRSPIYTSEEVSNPENSTHIQISSDIRSSKHITLDSKQIVEKITFEGSASDLSSANRRDIFSQMKDPIAMSTSVSHIQIDPKEIHVEREIYEVPFSTGDHDLFEETVKKITLGQKDTSTSDQNIYEGSFTKTSDDGSTKPGEEKVLDVNTTIGHIKLSPKEFVSEQIVFTEPISEQHQKVHELGQMLSSEGSVHRIKLGQEEVQSHDFMSQDFVLESPGIGSSQEDTLEKISPAEISRSTHHIQIGQRLHSPDTQLFSGMEFPHTDGLSENSKSVGQIRIGQKETSFTFQMDISKMGGREPQATLVVSSRQEAGQPEGGMEEVWKDPESEQKSEESTFDQTVQLQRMVDQRSVISDEKKIALLYLNENEGEDEDQGPWF